jgi:hypothetical protein
MGFLGWVFIGFPTGQIGFPMGQKWLQREEDEVLGSAGSLFAYLMGWCDGLAVEDVIGEVADNGLNSEVQSGHSRTNFPYSPRVRAEKSEIG